MWKRRLEKGTSIFLSGVVVDLLDLNLKEVGVRRQDVSPQMILFSKIFCPGGNTASRNANGSVHEGASSSKLHFELRVMPLKAGLGFEPDPIVVLLG